MLRPSLAALHARHFEQGIGIGEHHDCSDAAGRRAPRAGDDHRSADLDVFEFGGGEPVHDLRHVSGIGGLAGAVMRGSAQHSGKHFAHVGHRAQPRVGVQMDR